MTAGPPEGTDAEVVAALHELAVLVCRGVPGCDGASVSLLLQDGRPATLAASKDEVHALDEQQWTAGRGPCLTAMRERRVVGIEDVAADHRWPEVLQAYDGAGVRSSLSLPLPLAGTGDLLGGLNLYGERAGAFDGTARSAAESFARQTGMLLGYLRDLRAERAGRAVERELSATLQRSLLPVLPDLRGVSCAARYLPGSADAQVGGDWYDVFALPDGAIGIAIGDVMGHDLEAAAAMGQLRSVLRSYAYEGSSPSVVLDRLDRLVQDFAMAQLATAVYGRLVLDQGSAMLLFTNAGHLPPLLRLPDGSVQVLRRGRAPLIGAVPPGQADRGEGAAVLPGGATLLLYTDGLVDRRGRDVDESVEDLAGTLAAVDVGASPDEVCEALLHTVVRDGVDDTALLAVRVEARTAAR